MKLTKSLLLFLTTSIALCEMAGAAALVTVAVSTDSRSLQNASGVALSGGNPVIDGDGTAVQIGYYQGATANTIFFGNGDETTFVTLIGAGSVLGLNLTVGDSVVNAPANGEIFADINVIGSSAFYPAAGVPLVMRFFSSTSVSGSPFFQVISNLAWKWVAPVNLPSIARVDMNFDIPGMASRNGAAISADGTPIRAATANPLFVPEPTSFLLLSSVGVIAFARRNRK